MVIIYLNSFNVKSVDIIDFQIVETWMRWISVKKVKRLQLNEQTIKPTDSSKQNEPSGVVQ